MTRTSISSRRVLASALLASATFFPWQANAHDGENHDAPPPEIMDAGSADTLFPVDLGGPFTLTDQNGNRRSPSDFENRRLLVFFGFARCESICPVALKFMLDAVDILGPDGDSLQPVLITIDPENETPEVLAEELPKLHSRLMGLTGTQAEVDAVRKLFRVNAEYKGVSHTGNPIYAHGSFVYLLDENGKVETLLPPVFDGQGMAARLRPYLALAE